MTTPFFSSQIQTKNNPLSTPVLMIIGLGIAQILGACQIAWSNRQVWDRMEVLAAVGYQTIPGETIKPGLLSFSAAMGGGLFFTLTIGALLTISTIGILQVSMCRLKRPNWGFAAVAIGVIGVLVGCNLNGVNLFCSLYLILIPLTLCLVSAIKGLRPVTNGFFFQILLVFGPLILLILLGVIRFDRHTFIDVRDHLLLTNRPGQFVNDFYYRYSLFPAESIKSLDQKQIRTVYLDDDFRPSVRSSVGNVLSAHDFFPISKRDLADIFLKSNNDGYLVLKAKNGSIMARLDTFLNQPVNTLRELSEKSDHHRRFRKIIFWSMILGFPLLTYMIAAIIIRRLLAWILPRRMVTFGSSIVCLALVLIFMWPFLSNNRINSLNEGVGLITSLDLDKRLRGLKFMDLKRVDISVQPAYSKIKQSRHAAERYWLARLLGYSRGTSTHQDLLELLNDVSPNVVCMALRSLGLRKNRKSIPKILTIMSQSDHWYVQWYAYKALKDLTWRQSALN